MNAMRSSSYGSRTGSALVTVMGVVMLIAVVGAGMVTLGRQQIHSARRLRDYAKAQIIAESGANDAYCLLKTNFAARNNPANFPLKSFGGGTYDATVIPVGSVQASIICTGECGLSKAVVRVDIKNYPITTTNAPPVVGVSPYGYSILSGGNIGWNGNSDLQMSNGFMHANGAYWANGVNTARGNVESCVGITLVGQAAITGQGKAPFISPTNRVGTNVISSVPLMAIPDIDLAPYYAAAQANGQVYAGDRSIAGNVSPPGGIMWVNGNLQLGNGNYTGCFIATGDIELKTTSSSGTITNSRVARYPVLISRDGDITVKQAKTWAFNGLVYAKSGGFEKQGNGDVFGTGAIIAAGDVTKNGGWSGMLYSDPTPVPPGGSNTSENDHVVITAWQD